MTEYLLSPESVVADDQSVGDWKHYYIGRFADRDMLMRFIGMAIGHMTHSNAPKATVGVSAEALGADYEYMDEAAKNQFGAFECAEEAASDGEDSDSCIEAYSSEGDGKDAGDEDDDDDDDDAVSW
ncbi:hypothetical protein RSOL_547090, partial [Rhizoctonia solani AG-3 Rhs1AP]